MPDSEPLQQLDYATPTPRKKRWVIGLPLLLILLAAAGCLLFLLVQPRLISVRPTSNRAMCASNMHQIGLAILLYQNDHQQNYPNTLEELLEEQITPAVFICPSSNDTASAGATTQAVAADFHASGHLSYIYLGKGLNDKTADPDIVVLYEPLTDHAGDGMNILFGDGHAEWFTATVGKQLIAAAATGQRVKIDAGVVSTAPIATTQPQAK